MEFNIVMGSGNDIGKLMEGALRATSEIGDDLTVNFITASAHRTPKYVHEVAKGSVVGAAAGLSNGLAGKIEAECVALNGVTIGIPVSGGTMWRDLASFASTSELPSLYPVASVGVNNSYGAIHIAHSMMSRKWRESDLVVLYGDPEATHEGMPVLEELARHEIYNTVTHPIHDLYGAPIEGKIVLLVSQDASHMDAESDIAVSRKVKDSLIIGCPMKGSIDRMASFTLYVGKFAGLKKTMVVGEGRYSNAVQLAMSIMSLDDPRRMVPYAAERDQKAREVVEQELIAIRDGKRIR